MGTVTVLTLTDDQAKALALLPKLVDEIQRARSREAIGADGQPLSAHEVARMVRRRTADVLAALKAGELPARFVPSPRTGKGRWRVKPEDAKRWADASAGR